MNFILLFIFSTSLWAKTCAGDLKSFRELFDNETYPLTWEETTADDGKPLVVKITEEKGKLFLEFVKTKEGLWASGTADICKDEGEIVATISKEQIKLGKAAHWAIKMSMKNGASFKLIKLKPLILKISTFGWSGEFIPKKEI
ncbi:MAG: hypothetical protein V4598_17755 [Bdellovibrionota bacterium]